MQINFLHSIPLNWFTYLGAEVCQSFKEEIDWFLYFITNFVRNSSNRLENKILSSVKICQRCQKEQDQPTTWMNGISIFLMHFIQLCCYEIMWKSIFHGKQILISRNSGGLVSKKFLENLMHIKSQVSISRWCSIVSFGGNIQSLYMVG